MPTTVYEHEAALRTFERMVSRGRLASTFLFVGPEGVGKRTFAMRLAEGLLCKASPDDSLQPCGHCESCRLIAAGSHPDLLTIGLPKGKSSLPVDLFIGDREHRNRLGLCHEIALKPYLGSRRVAVIDQADYLSAESANCLLKTLEEPPPRSVLILIGVSLSRQLPTIRSRCQVVRFPALKEETVERILREQQLVEEGADAPRLAAASRGSVTQALVARDQEATDFRDAVIRQLGQRLFDPIRLAAEILAFVAEAGSEASARRVRLAGLLDAAIHDYRDKMTRPAEGAMSPETAVLCLSLCLDAEAALNRNANQAALVQYWLTGLWRAGR
ncbi:MAG: DNA polymerase III subunit delta' [Planctomycetales bacterium]|nr:DNA polymerase III subunit delta' [Planctomycetales bacterium]